MASDQKAAFSIPSLIALVSSILILFRIVEHGFLTFLLAGVAIVFGLLGMVLSLSPKVRGGIFSFLGVAAGLIGVIIAVVKLFQWIF